MTGEDFIDVDFCQRAKTGQVVSGDVFLSRKIRGEGRIVSVLSDGLGSGVKASVLANLTATMALRYTSAFVDVRKSAWVIMDTLPICEQRKISYATFTIVDLDDEGRTRVIEHGNPALVLLRGRAPIPLERTDITLETWKDRTIRYSERINEAHQDLNVPVELDLRRNVIRRIASRLESQYLKECPVRFL